MIAPLPKRVFCGILTFVLYHIPLFFAIGRTERAAEGFFQPENNLPSGRPRKFAAVICGAPHTRANPAVRTGMMSLEQMRFSCLPFFFDMVRRTDNRRTGQKRRTPRQFRRRIRRQTKITIAEAQRNARISYLSAVFLSICCKPNTRLQNCERNSAALSCGVKRTSKSSSFARVMPT